MAFHTEESWLEWFDRLSNEAFCCIDNFIDDDLLSRITEHFDKKVAEGVLTTAGIGTAAEHQIDKSIRSDRNLWISPSTDIEISDFFDLANETRAMLNRYCYLSLSDYEFQLSEYPVGAHYNKHVDQFRDRNNRMISLVIYLNKAWKEGDGGEIRIFREEGDIDIQPVGGRAVIFRSDTVEHEVLETHRVRRSVSGWFLYQPMGLGYL